MADEVTTNTNSGTNLTLKIFNTDENNPLFNATDLTWAQIVDLWDECCSIYANKNFKIINSDGTQEKIIDKQENEITTVSTDALEDLKGKAKVYNGAYIGTLTWTYGHDKEHLLQAESEEDAKTKFQNEFKSFLSKNSNAKNFFTYFNIDIKPYSKVYQLSTTETNTDSSGNETGTGSSGNETETGSSREGTETGSSGDEPAPSNDTGD